MKWVNESERKMKDSLFFIVHRSEEQNDLFVMVYKRKDLQKQEDKRKKSNVIVNV